MKSARTRILGWVLLPLLVALAGTYFASALLLRESLSTQIDQQLTQEANELTFLAERAIDPESGQKYASARDLLEIFIRASVPADDETIFVMVEGSVFERSSGATLPRLDQNTEFVSQIAGLRNPVIKSFGQGAEEVRFIALPINGKNDQGHMVAAIYVEKRFQAVNTTLGQLAIFISLAFALAVGLGWYVAGKILLPIRQLARLTRGISDATTQERLVESGQNSEISAITQDFNSMLDRTSSAFASQKRFVDDAGHELKTPLTIIRGHLDLLRTAPEETETSLAIIEDEVLRMSRIVKDLQTLTKSSEPSFIQTVVVEPSEIVDEVFVKSAPLSNRKWSVEAPEIGEYKLDKQRMVQALVQLVDNAIKHTKEADSITIGCRRTSAGIELFVGDSGHGIPIEERSRVQERFVRGQWTPEDTDGSGLGLAIVDAIAKGHKGSITIGTSELGGAEVGVSIPISESVMQEGVK
jgi:two-component system OmpR family sensor kinase